MQFTEATRMQEIPFSPIRAIFEEAQRMEREGINVIRLEQGRPDFDTPAHIKEAAQRALQEGFVHYTSNFGTLELRQAISEKLKRENGVEARPESEIIVTVGSNEAISLAMMAFLNPGDEILVPDPSWLHYFYCARLAGAVPVGVPILAGKGFRMDAEDVERAITPRTRMIVVNTPHNPTGYVLTAEDLSALAQVIVKHNLIAISDEIYEHLIYEGARHLSLATFPGMAERTVTINGFSKAYSMTGWRLGYLAAAAPLIKPMIKIHQYTTNSATSFAQAGAVAAYRGPQDCVREMLAEFDRRRRMLVEGLAEMPGFKIVPPRGAFYAFPDVTALNRKSMDLSLYLLREAHVALVAGSAFGDYGEGYIRLSYANSYENIQEALDRIKTALARL